MCENGEEVVRFITSELFYAEILFYHYHTHIHVILALKASDWSEHNL